jgi:adenylate cyclase
MSRAMAIAGETVGSTAIFTVLSRLPPGLRSSPHIHTNCESSIYVASGQGRMLIGANLDRALLIQPGDFLFVPPGAPHVVVNDGDGDLVLVVSRNTSEERVEEYLTPRERPPDDRKAPLAKPLLLDRCKTCRTPIRGPLAIVSRMRGIQSYGKNPQLCTRCETSIKGSEDRVVTIMFADIRGYSSMVSEGPNDVLLSVLRGFFNTAAPVVYDSFGVVDQFLGDGMKVLFNVPVPRVTHTEDAVDAALTMQERFRDAPFGVGIGIETGMAIAGHIGVDTVVDFTCVGETVNLAARLQSIAAPGEIVLGPTAWRKASNLVHERGLTATAERMELKGFGEVDIHRLAPRKPPV